MHTAARSVIQTKPIMRKITTSVLMFISGLTLTAQTPHPIIQKMVSEMQTDSLDTYLNEFTGERSCIVNGSKTTIKNRVSKNGNDVAADYLKEHLQKLGLTVTDQKYSSGGRNIIAEQVGTTYPDQKYIICGHYDSMADYCADDDASSCVAILESARLLTKQKFKYTIVYAFWDEEEQGLIGSAYYAKQAKSKSDKIKGVLNLEMLGYDSNKDFMIEVHTKSSSLALSDKLTEVNKTYKFALKPSITNPGTPQSDHGSFWNQGYMAICFGEAFFKNDANPGYHKSTDRIGLFNMPYYYELCRLSLAAIATLAEPDEQVGINTVDDKTLTKLEAYPNPSKGAITIDYEVPQRTEVQLSVYNILSQTNEIICMEMQDAGSHQSVLNSDKLVAGTYLITLKTNTHTLTRKLVVEK